MKPGRIEVPEIKEKTGGSRQQESVEATRNREEAVHSFRVYFDQASDAILLLTRRQGVSSKPTAGRYF